ncbi:nicotinamide-nucleotide amidohydrolase family protein [Gammaproteobacteria bacterium]|nr:nicotinamide-nucleotide amidohydrolase family protein [Gammaproteobacteria bacterium]
MIKSLAKRLVARGWQLVTAESCTGGLVAASMTDRAGSSDWFAGGWVVYSNGLKNSELGVPHHVLERHGAVSAPVVAVLAEQAAQRSGAQLAVSVSGVAGPGGGSVDKPVGTVWIGVWADDGRGAAASLHHFSGDRAAVRQMAVTEAVKQLIVRLDIAGEND